MIFEEDNPGYGVSILITDGDVYSSVKDPVTNITTTLFYEV